VVLIARKFDARPVVGIIVVFLVIGLAAFGIYYFFVAKPSADALTASKLTAMEQVNSLVSIGTPGAISKASGFSAEIESAESAVEVESVLVGVNAAIQVEQTRKDLLDLTSVAADGTYFSATGAAGKTVAPSLTDLFETFVSDINSKINKSDLEAYRSEIDGAASWTWRNLLSGELNKLGDNVAMFKSSPVSGAYMTKAEARNYISTLGWANLREMKFESHSTVEVPVLDSFQRTPTLKADSSVNIYIYDTTTGTMDNLWSNATVRRVLYSQTDIARISWILTEGVTTDSFSTDMWETVKAAAAGSEGAENLGWSGYGADVVERALEANIGQYALQVIYMVEVPDEIGKLIAQCEFQETFKDIVMVARI